MSDCAPKTEEEVIDSLVKVGLVRRFVAEKLPSAPGSPSNRQSRLKKKEGKLRTRPERSPAPGVSAARVRAEGSCTGGVTTFLDSSKHIVLRHTSLWHSRLQYLYLFYIKYLECDLLLDI